MNCPVCRAPMIVVEHNAVELDYCMKCAGVWFDRDELEHLLSGVSLQIEKLQLHDAPRADAAGERPRRCPLCRKGMKKLSVGGTPPLILDRCERHGGYWFDGGELAAPLRRGAPSGDWKHIVEFLGGIFPSEMPDNDKET